jgi:hypothetical protein
MELGARRTGHDFIELRLVRRLLEKQSLHFHARPGTSKYDHFAHGANIGHRTAYTLIQIKFPIGGQRFLLDRETPARIGKNRDFPLFDRRQASSINLNRPTVELLRSVQVHIESSCQGANEKP